MCSHTRTLHHTLWSLTDLMDVLCTPNRILKMVKNVSYNIEPMDMPKDYLRRRMACAIGWDTSLGTQQMWVLFSCACCECVVNTLTFRWIQKNKWYCRATGVLRALRNVYIDFITVVNLSFWWLKGINRVVFCFDWIETYTYFDWMSKCYKSMMEA